MTQNNSLKKKSGFHIDFGSYGIIYALLLFWVIMAITNSNFRAVPFYQTILIRASLNAICGVGMTFAIISGDFDLSIASQVALNSVVFTNVLPIIGLVPSILLVLTLGILMGTFNGILVAKLRIPAFIATLGMQMGYRALAQLINSSPTVVNNSFFKKIATHKIGGILPTAFVILIVLALLGNLVLRRTKLGRNILAIGNSKQAAAISGINVQKTQIMTFLIVGLFTAAASIMITSNLGSSNYGMQNGLEFTVISAVVLGGTALSGGKGSILNTIAAAIFLVTIRSALDAYAIDSYWQKVIEGVILVVAFSITEIRNIANNLIIKYRTRKKLNEAKANAPTA